MGLLDLIQALTFIQDNIASFGGDATRVTISGQSAGGAAVGFLVMSPLAEGTTHKIITSHLCADMIKHTPDSLNHITIFLLHP